MPITAVFFSENPARITPQAAEALDRVLVCSGGIYDLVTFLTNIPKDKSSPWFVCGDERVLIWGCGAERITLEFIGDKKIKLYLGKKCECNPPIKVFRYNRERSIPTPLLNFIPGKN